MPDAYSRRPGGMLKHVVTRHPEVPSHMADAIKADFLTGHGIREIADRYSLAYNAVRSMVWQKGKEWREEERFARIKPDARRIVVPMDFLEYGTWRTIPCSLPRITMHVLAMEERA